VLGFGAPTGPGTTMPPPRKTKKSAVDPEMVAKLKQKMKDQGMLEEQDEG